MVGRRNAPGNVKVILRFVSFLGFLLLVNPANAACPPNSEQIGRTTRGDKTYFYCRCLGEKLNAGGRCVAPEQVPLSARAFAIITGQAFSAGAALQTYARTKNWPAHIVHSLDFGTLEAKFGNYKRARDFLEAVQKYAGPDRIVVQVDNIIAHMDDSRRDELARLFGKYPSSDEELFVAELLPLWKCGEECEKKALYFRALMQARLDRESGAYSSAIKKYEDARRIAQLAGLKVDYRRTANEGIVWSRALRASSEAHKNPKIADAWKSYARARRQEMAALRAETLATHLSEAGNGRAAIPYLQEAHAYYRKMDPKRAPLVATEIARLQANDKANVMSEKEGGRPLTIYTNASSQTDIMFDAIEYGKGDWFRSIKYLEDALAADPKNAKIFGALNQVKGLSAAAP